MNKKSKSFSFKFLNDILAERNIRARGHPTNFVVEWFSDKKLSEEERKKFVVVEAAAAAAATQKINFKVKHRLIISLQR